MSATFDPIYLNGVYERESGFTSKLAWSWRYDAQQYWAEFLKAGYGEQELLTVLNYLNAEVRKGKRRPASMRLRTLIGDLANGFESELSLAKESQLRFKPPETPRQEILRAVHKPQTPTVRPTQPIGPTVAQLLANLKAAAE